MTPNPHIESMKLFIEDVEQFGTDAHTHWRFRIRGGSSWRRCKGMPRWSPALEYSRVPKTILINGRDVPEPARTRPDHGLDYWVPSLLHSERVLGYVWKDDEMDRRWFAAGFIHLTREAAVAHAEALCSFTALPDK
jgi:hypothetical protein